MLSLSEQTPSSPVMPFSPSDSSISTSIESRLDNLLDRSVVSRRGTWSFESDEADDFCSELGAKVARVGVLASSCRDDGSRSCDCCKVVLGRGVEEKEEEEGGVVICDSSLMGSSMSEFTGRKGGVEVVRIGVLESSCRDDRS